MDDNCQVLCNYKNTKILILEPPKFILKPPPVLPSLELLRLNISTARIVNLTKKCSSSNSTTRNNIADASSPPLTTQLLNTDYSLFIILLYSCLVLISLLILFAIIYLVLSRRNLKLKLKREQQEQQQLQRANHSLNRFHTIISNLTSSPTITASTALSGPVMNGFMPEIQLNNSNTSSTSSYEYYMNNSGTACKVKTQRHNHKQQPVGYNNNENDALLSKIDYYSLRMNNNANTNANRLLQKGDETITTHLKPLLETTKSKLLSSLSSSPSSTTDIYSNRYATIYDDNNEKYILIPKTSSTTTGTSYLTYEKIKLQQQQHQMMNELLLNQAHIIQNSNVNASQTATAPLLILYNQNYHKVYETLINSDIYENHSNSTSEEIAPIDIIYEHILDDNTNNDSSIIPQAAQPPKASTTTTTFSRNSINFKKYPKTNPNM